MFRCDGRHQCGDGDVDSYLCSIFRCSGVTAGISAVTGMLVMKQTVLSHTHVTRRHSGSARTSSVSLLPGNVTENSTVRIAQTRKTAITVSLYDEFVIECN